jgi:hypothetical protein
MTLAALDLAGERVVLDGRGAVFLPDHATLVVADLHLEKGQAFAAAGRMLPPYDTRATLARLVALLNDHRPERVVSLGDGFHRRHGWERLGAEDRAQLRAIADVCAWTWLAGNHDPDAPTGHGEAVAGAFTLGALTLRHLPAGGTGEIAGHLHPRAALRVRGRRVTRRCFASDGQRLVMPALGAFTGGLDVWDPAIAELFAGPFEVWLCGKDERLRRLPAQRLEGAPRRASSRSHG